MFNEKTTESAVSLSLTANNLDGGSYIARVPYKALDLDNIVSDIAAQYPSLDPAVIIHAAELLKKQILSYIMEGKAVNILDIVTVHAEPKTVVPRANPQSSQLPELTLKFKATQEAKDALAAVSATSFMVRTPEPEIAAIISLKDGSADGALHKGYPVRITGAKLKVAGEEGGIFFVPPDAEGEPSKDEGAWIKAADSSYIPLNYPKKLEFNIPDSVEEGKRYFIAVRTAYSPSGRLRKDAVTGFSAQAVVIQ